jgi:hypothetical protein
MNRFQLVRLEFGHVRPKIGQYAVRQEQPHTARGAEPRHTIMDFKMSGHTASMLSSSSRHASIGCLGFEPQLDADCFSQSLQLVSDGQADSEAGQLLETDLGRQKAEDGSDFGAPQRQFLPQAQGRIWQMRLEFCSLIRAQEACKRQALVAGLADQSRCLADCAAAAGYAAAAQVGAALEAVCNEVGDTPVLIDTGALRSIAEGIDLLMAVTACVQEKVGQASGARIVIFDTQSASRSRILGILNEFGIPGIGIASVETGLRLLSDPGVELAMAREDSPNETARLCQAIRRFQRHGKTPILVLASSPGQERRTQYALAGATEIIEDSSLGCKLALKALNYLFRGRLSAPGSPSWQ